MCIWDNTILALYLYFKGGSMKSTHTKEYASFLELLMRIRKRNNMTQSKLAQFLDKPQSYVSKYESGERRLDIVEFFDIARALNENPISLLKELGFEEA